MNRLEKQIEKAMLCMTRQCWEQGVAAQVLMELGHLEETALMAHDMVLRQSGDGRLCNVENTPAVTDSAFCVPAVYEVAERTGNERYKKAVQKNIVFFLRDARRAEDGTLYHMIDTADIWADSAAFLPYALALTGHVKEGIAQMDGICRRLYDQKSGLYFHMWNEEKKDFTRPVLWGIGNGWILTGLIRLYRVVKEAGMAETERIEQEMLRLLDKMTQMLDQEYLLHDVLDDADSFRESESSAMLAYAIYSLEAEGVLPDGFWEMAEGIRLALSAKITTEGLVSDACSSPDFVRPGTAVECQAHFLMMEEARRRSDGLLKK